MGGVLPGAATMSYLAKTHPAVCTSTSTATACSTSASTATTCSTSTAWYYC